MPFFIYCIFVHFIRCWTTMLFTFETNFNSNDHKNGCNPHFFVYIRIPFCISYTAYCVCIVISFHCYRFEWQEKTEILYFCTNFTMFEKSLWWQNKLKLWNPFPVYDIARIDCCQLIRKKTKNNFIFRWKEN